MATKQIGPYEYDVDRPADLASFNDVAPRHKRCWVVVEDLLAGDIKPVPSIINTRLGRDSRRSLDKVECQIRTYLLTVYGYTLQANGRWEK